MCSQCHKQFVHDYVNYMTHLITRESFFQDNVESKDFSEYLRMNINMTML